MRGAHGLGVLRSRLSKAVERGVSHVRVTTAFNKMLDLPGAWVATVSFAEDGLVLGLGRRRARPVCPCGRRGTGSYDRSVRRWRHLVRVIT